MLRVTIIVIPQILHKKNIVNVGPTKEQFSFEPSKKQPNQWITLQCRTV